MWLFLFRRTNAFLICFILLCLLGLVAKFGTALCFWHFVVCGMLFLALLLGLPTAWDVSLHLLSIGHHELQAFPAGKTTPVMPDDVVIQERVIIFDHIRANRAARHVVLWPHLRFFKCVDRNAREG